MSDYASSWDFTMANYDAVWGFLVQLGLLLLFLMLVLSLRHNLFMYSAKKDAILETSGKKQCKEKGRS